MEKQELSAAEAFVQISKLPAYIGAARVFVAIELAITGLNAVYQATVNGGSLGDIIEERLGIVGGIIGSPRAFAIAGLMFGA